MGKETKEKIKLSIREILLTFCDGITKIEEIFGYSWQRKEARKYWKWRELDKNRFYQSLWRLEKQGYIKRYQNSKKSLIKLTPVGKKKAIEYIFRDYKIRKPKTWDKKWRMVIFDIPENKKTLREAVRGRLKRWDFCQIQKSVFVYPYDCRKEIYSLKYLYSISAYLQYIVAESIETEIDLVDYFFDLGILSNDNK